MGKKGERSDLPVFRRSGIHAVLLKKKGRGLGKKEERRFPALSRTKGEKKKREKKKKGRMY